MNIKIELEKIALKKKKNCSSLKEFEKKMEEIREDSEVDIVFFSKENIREMWNGKYHWYYKN